MAYFNLLQCYSEQEIDTLDNNFISITYSTSRFAEYTDEPIRLKFKELTEESLLILRNFPCFICFENFQDFVAIAELRETKLNNDNNTITATFRLLSDKISTLKPKDGHTNRYTYICDLEELEKAMNKNIDFVTYSPIFDTPNKGQSKGVDKLNEVIEKFPNLKIFALGGIIQNEQIKEIEKTKAYGFASIRYFI